MNKIISGDRLTPINKEDSNTIFRFKNKPDEDLIPNELCSLFKKIPHPLAILAAEELQQYLLTLETQHNFGLDENSTGPVIGKMFGVLVVMDGSKHLGFLAAFSGKISNSYHLHRFVPPVFDSLTKNSFLNTGMRELSQINFEIKSLESVPDVEHHKSILSLKRSRKLLSARLQYQLFQQYQFINQRGDSESLLNIFRKFKQHDPPSGAGDCAAPKLLQFAFTHNLKPLAMAEFWWGRSPKSETWKHRHFYPACNEKCRPILQHMLS